MFGICLIVNSTFLGSGICKEKDHQCEFFFFLNTGVLKCESKPVPSRRKNID